MDPRDKENRFALVALSVALHALVFYAAGKIERPERDTTRLIEFEVAEEPPKPEPPKPEPPKPKPPEPEPPKPPPDPPPDPEPKVEPKVKPKVKPPPQAEPEPAPPPAAKKFRLPPSQTVAPGQGDGTQVDPGQQDSGGVDPRGDDQGSKNGTRNGKGDKAGGTDPNAKGTATPTEKPWKPASDLYIRQLPKVAQQPPKLQCPATREGVTGTVVLKVQVRRDGGLRSVKIAKGIGSGCDEIAIKALKKAKFKPAIATDGSPTDYELRYEYVFKPAD